MKQKSLLLITLFAGMLAAQLRQPAQQQPAVHEIDSAPWRVGYVMLGVHSLDKTIAFYRDKLGLKLQRKAEDIAWFDGGGISLVFSPEVDSTPGGTEIVFAVGHVERAYQGLMHAGVIFERKPHALDPASWAASFRDPDGHMLSLYGPQ